MNDYNTKSKYMFWLFLVPIYITSSFACELTKIKLLYDESNIAYYDYCATFKVKMLILILCFIYFIGFGFVLGLRKDFKSLIAFIFLLLSFNGIATVFSLFNESVSNLLWGVYLAPISLLIDGMDVFVYVVYYVLFCVPFALGIMVKKVYH